MNLSLDMPPPGPLVRQGADVGPVRSGRKSKSNRYNPMGTKPEARKPLAIKLPSASVLANLPPLPATPRGMSVKEKTATSNKLSPEDLFAAAFGTPMEQVEVSLRNFTLPENDNKKDV